jgi:hypothetical protein
MGMDGYECVDGDGNGPTECLPSGTGPGVIGATCQNIADCSGGLAAGCIAEESDGDWSGGYCIMDCLSDSACPSGSTCIGEDLATGVQGTCFADCTNDTDCRDANYFCETETATGDQVCIAAGFTVN